MPKPLSLKTMRKELTKNCDVWVNRFVEHQKLITKGSFHEKIHEEANSIGTSLTLDIKEDTTAVSDLLILVHAVLIQEWLIFLDSVFEKSVLYCLQNNLVERLPNISFSIKKVEPIHLVEMRESICLALKDRFSFHIPYPNKIKNLHKIFEINPEQQPRIKKLQSEMKKQVTVRNVWQHHKGKIRPRDFDENIQFFEMLNKEGNPEQRGIDEFLEITKPEVDRLKKVIEDYSKEFEELK